MATTAYGVHAAAHSTTFVMATWEKGDYSLKQVFQLLCIFKKRNVVLLLILKQLGIVGQDVDKLLVRLLCLNFGHARSSTVDTLR
jgi:hypothetical protein